MSDLYTTRLREALEVARGGNIAIVIVPTSQYTRGALALLGHMLDPEKDWNAVVDSHMLHFTGTRGSVRIYPADHVTYDPKQKRLFDYPASVPTFLHPDVETP